MNQSMHGCRSGGAWSGGLNAHAAAFVPAAAAAVTTPEPLRFGDLPESLNATPHISNPDAQEWAGQNGDAEAAQYDQVCKKPESADDPLDPEHHSAHRARFFGARRGRRGDATQGQELMPA